MSRIKRIHFTQDGFLAHMKLPPSTMVVSCRVDWDNGSGTIELVLHDQGFEDIPDGQVPLVSDYTPEEREKMNQEFVDVCSRIPI